MTYSSPTDLTSALQLVAETDGKVIAGGTDVYPALQQGKRPARFMDVSRIDGFSGVSKGVEGFRIGAAVTWSQVIKTDLPPAFDALKQAAREVGSIQIQNAGTLVGNLCNASPAADGVPPLLALNASVEIASTARGIRTLLLADFIKGVRQIDLARDELVTAILVPMPSPDAVSAFEKLGSRQ